MGRREFKSKDREALYIKQNGCCADCNKPLRSEWHPNSAPRHQEVIFSVYEAQIHHIIPIMVGGKHKPENWILLCNSCHSKRHTDLYRAGLFEYPEKVNSKLLSLLGVTNA